MPAQLLICANLLPIGTYFCVLGVLHASRRPMVTTGTRDFAALAVALSGLAINGPLRLLLESRLLPDAVVRLPGIAVVVYLVIVAAVALAGSDRIVLYNSTTSTVSAAVRAILERGGQRFQQVAGGWMLNDRGVSLELDSFPALDIVTVHFRMRRDRELFEQVHGELTESFEVSSSGLSFAGLLLAGAGGVILALPIYILARDPRGIVALVRQAVEAWQGN